MNKFWKIFGLTALAAAVPVRIRKDEETGKKTYQSLLWKLDVGPSGNDDGKTEVGLDLMEGVLTAPVMKAITAKRETVLFADDEPEAAVVPNVIDFAQAAKAQEEAAADPSDEAQAEPADFEDSFDPEL